MTTKASNQLVTIELVQTKNLDSHSGYIKGFSSRIEGI